MLRVIFRFVGLMLLAAGFAAVVIDGTRSIASNALVLTSFGDTAARLAPARMALLQAAIEKKFGHWAWDPATTTLLAAPTWLIVGGLGALLFLATRRRRAPIGYSSR
jgi:hypothetical protein